MPLLKWVGGKTQILDSVLSRFPPSFDNYHEPFVGGGSVLLGLLESPIEVRGTLYASDLNPYLIHFYSTLRDRPDELIAAVKRIPCSTEEEYYDLRTRFNATRSELSLDTAAQFLLLNRTCFRGVYREGPSGFNVPFGHYKNPYVIDEDEVRATSAKLANVVFTAQSFESALERAEPHDFAYLDPPYVGTFVGYNAGGFPEATHNLLFQKTKELPCPFLMSNSDHPTVRAAFPDHNIESVKVRRAIHSKNPAETAGEVLIRRV